MSIEATEKRSGTQTIERAVALLREIALSGPSGGKLSDIAARCDLRKSTAHRMLTCLIRENLVQRRPDDRRYMLGSMLFELGVSAQPERAMFLNTARSRLSTLAKQTNGVAFLFFRSGDDFVCAQRVGFARLQARGLTIFPGTRRPLVTAAGGVAFLTAIPFKEAMRIIKRNYANLSKYNDASIEGITRMLNHSTEIAFAVNAGEILSGVNEYGLALRDRSGNPFASISLAGHDQDLPIEKLDEYRCILEEAATGLQAGISFS